jgi:predicted nuclease of predicted toxin-antitoxin system
VKLLFDQNLSATLCRSLADCFPGSVHVREIGLRDADDAIIWSYAARHGLAIVTKDADFRQRSFLLGHPPKIVWVRLGNCSTRAVEKTLRLRVPDIREFLADDQKSILALSH